MYGHTCIRHSLFAIINSYICCYGRRYLILNVDDEIIREDVEAETIDNDDTVTEEEDIPIYIDIF